MGAEGQSPGYGAPLFAVIVGIWGALWIGGGVLVLVFGFVNRNAPELGALAALLALFLVGPMLVVFGALLMICAFGLWQGGRWSLALLIALALVQFSGALLLLSAQVWLPAIVGLGTAATAIWYAIRLWRQRLGT